MKAKLELVLLGPPQVRLLGKPVTGFKTHKAQALLYYLAVTGHFFTRSSLAGLLWGDMAESSAHVNLSKALSELRATVGEFVIIERDRIAFKQESDHWLDLFELEKGKEIIFKQEAIAQSNLLNQVGEKVSLYLGDFLQGFYVRDAPDFEVWMLTEREQRRTHVVQTLERLVEISLLQGRWKIGLDYARRLLVIEPWRETAHRQMMLLFAQSGQRTSALAQYQICRQVLAEELGIEPDTLTTNLYELIRRGQLEGNALVTDPIAANIQPVGERMADQSSSPTHLRQNLAHYPTPFIGREQEISAILDNLQEPTCRLLNLAGPGGIGKTRLALEVAQSLQDNPSTGNTFVDGIFFVPLQPVTTEHGIISAIATATAFQFYGNLPPRQQLLCFLRQKQILLVLDNFEHLLPHADLIEEMLEGAPEMKLLLTSRVALNMRQEWFYPVSGLRFSAAPSAGQEAISQYEAVRLFVQCARRVQPNFSLISEQEQVLHICRLVGGMPLGIELAAAWLRAFSCTEIATEIEKDFGILTARYQDIPERHRSIRVLMEQSWQMLAEAEQEVLMRLAVFPQDFTYHAAQYIAGATLPIVTTLVEKCMLQTVQIGRFRMHELLRQFAEQKLTAHSASAATALRNHAAYYLGFVHQQTARLLSHEQHQALIDVDYEIHNVRAAWQRAVTHGAAREIDNAIDGLFDYYCTRGHYQEGCDCFGLAASHLSTSIDSGESLLFSRLLSRQAQFYCRMGRAADAEAMLPLLNVGATSKHEEAFVLNLRGTVANILHKDRAQTESSLQQSLELFRELGDLSGQAMLLQHIAFVYQHFGSISDSYKLMAEALTVSRQFGQPSKIADMLVSLAMNSNLRGAYVDSQRCLQEALAIYQELGNDHGIGTSYNWLGWSHWCASNAPAAISCYEKAITKFQQSGVRVEYANVLGDLSLALLDLGDYERAMHSAREGLRICEATGDIHMTLYLLYTVGATITARSDFANARKYLTKSLALAQAHHVLVNSGPALLFFANLLMAESQATNDVELQYQKQSQARQLYRSVVSDPAGWQVYKDRAKVKLESITLVFPDIPSGEEPAETKSVEEWAIQILANDAASR
jgi:predicted ATPase/DNA-binding SARP family transcriptional activator